MTNITTPPLAALLIIIITTASHAQQPPADAKYRGVADCRLCHRGPEKEYEQAGALSRISLTESETWRNMDRHSEAYRVLVEPDGRGQRIGRLLGKDVTRAETGCIQCHLTTADSAQTVAETFPVTEQRLLLEGVGCESCHGPSSEWVTEHRTFATWSALSDEVKLARGFNNVYEPVVRALLCTSCHIGDAERGRLITHEMYAAGHPLLAGFEIESFADKMPRHWQYGYERKVEDAEPFERTRKLLVGSVVAVRRAVELAAADAAAPRDEDRWPELARMDCFACHHELTLPSWRQERGYRGQAGRPQLMLGSVELATAAARLTGEPAAVGDLQQVVDRLRRPFERNPFGDAEGIVDGSQPLVARCQTIERQLAELPLDRDDATRALQLIAEVAAASTHNYDTARQLAGAVTVILDELKAGATAADIERITKTAEGLRDRNFYFTEKSLTTTATNGGTKKVMVEALIQPLIENRAAYNPGQFSAQMARLASQLK